MHEADGFSIFYSLHNTVLVKPCLEQATLGFEPILGLHVISGFQAIYFCDFSSHLDFRYVYAKRERYKVLGTRHTSLRLQAWSYKLEATSLKLQAWGYKLEATSLRLQAQTLVNCWSSRSINKEPITSSSTLIVNHSEAIQHCLQVYELHKYKLRDWKASTVLCPPPYSLRASYVHPTIHLERRM